MLAVVKRIVGRGCYGALSNSDEEVAGV
jgi:hypothetical protein